MRCRFARCVAAGMNPRLVMTDEERAAKVDGMRAAYVTSVGLDRPLPLLTSEEEAVMRRICGAKRGAAFRLVTMVLGADGEVARVLADALLGGGRVIFL